jgi:lipopolysaccharide/colanic/teichoic acid biosynthesis glycosyltransferase
MVPMLTRIIDICFSLLGLLVLALCYPLVALLIKLDSRGPVFFKCNRVGLNGKIFQMYKFRTMVEVAEGLGPSVSPLGDPRVTSVGRLLRRLKVNEFPQFINLFKGEVTLFGPRPESPDLAAAYPPEAKKIFSVKPGLIGPNQILGRNEEESYPPGVDPIKYYIETLLPRKLPTDLQYIENQSILKNSKLFFQTLWVILAGVLSRHLLLNNWTKILLLLGDAFFCLFSFTLAHLLRFESLQVASPGFYKLLPLVVFVRLPVFFFFDFYQTLIRYLSLSDIKRIFTGVTVSSVALVGFAFFFGMLQGYSRGVFLIDCIYLSFLLSVYRGLAWKYLRYQRGKTTVKDVKMSILIWGAGDCGELCLRYLRRDPSFEIIGFIDDDLAKRGKRMDGVKILGDRHDLQLITQLYKIKKVVIAIAKAPVHELKQILRACRDLGLKTELFLEKIQVKEAQSDLLSLEEPLPTSGYLPLMRKITIWDEL